MKKIYTYKSGEISIMLVIIVMLLVTLTTAAVSLAISTTRDTTVLTMGDKALSIAESGAENAILMLIRDPSYLGESNLQVGAGSATIAVTGTGPFVVSSTGTIGNLVREVQVTIVTDSGQLAITNWQEL